jgi:hypothetical protein
MLCYWLVGVIALGKVGIGEYNRPLDIEVQTLV